MKQRDLESTSRITANNSKGIKLKIALAIVMAATLSVPAFAEGNKNTNTNNSYSQSYSSAHSSSRAQGGAGGAGGSANNAGNSQTMNYKERLQAPGMGVGAAYCSNGLSFSGPGFGFGFSAMERMCKIEIGARVVRTYINAPNAASYVCSQREFSNLPACRPRR